ncbi:MAG: hypothetical protein IPN76_26035 [Saprospiraceae bacterium]|nr:hypothetical protein [Saprospiraceae bacterium]
MLTGASVNGCDSTVNINLSFYPPAQSDFTPTLCPGESVTVNGTEYNQSNPTGTEVLTGASVNGCDSTVNINLSFYPPAQSDFTPTLCPGESVTVNGTEYNQSNPTGTEVLTGASVNGCDSTVNINLSFYPPAQSDFTPTLCPGESVTVNGTEYNQSNPNPKTEVLTGASVNGCDSTVNINLLFMASVPIQLDTTICAGGTVLFNGELLGASGEYEYIIPSVNGCDSMVYTLPTHHPRPLPSSCHGRRGDSGCRPAFHQHSSDRKRRLAQRTGR